MLDGAPDELAGPSVLDELVAYNVLDMIDEVTSLLTVLLSLVVALLGNDDRGPVELFREVGSSEKVDETGVMFSVLVPNLLVSDVFGVVVLFPVRLVSVTLGVEALVADELRTDSMYVADTRLFILIALSVLSKLLCVLLIASVLNVSNLLRLDWLELCIDVRLRSPEEIDRPSADALKDSLDCAVLKEF